MIVRFTIDPEALTDSSLTTNRHEDVVRQLQSLWLDLGALYLSVKNPCPFLKALESLPQSIQMRWRYLLTSAMKEGRVLRAEGVWPGPFGEAERGTIEKLAQLVELLLTRREAVTRLGIPQGISAGTPQDTKLEVCDFQFPSASETFATLRSARHSARVEVGENVRAALRRLFRVHAVLWSEVVVVDRFLITRFIGDSTGKSGVENLLNFLSEFALTRSITIYSAIPQTDETVYVSKLRKLVERTGQGHLLRLNLGLAEDRVFPDSQHFRYIRFGPELCWIDEGLQMLEGEKVAKLSLCDFRKYDDGLQRIESTLRAKSQVQTLTRAQPVQKVQGSGT